MTSKITMSEVKTSNSQITDETAPRTAVFVGSTAGIGKATVTRLISQQTAIKVYVVGRNATKHQEWIHELRESNKKAQLIFLEGEISLLAEVKNICEDIKAKESSLDAIFLSQAFIPYNGRQITGEGIDLFSSLAYYGRILFVMHLLPLLKNSSHNPRIVNLGGAGNEVSQLFLDDLDLEKPGNYTMWNSINHVATSMTLCLSRLADDNPSVICIWNMPGLVGTGIHDGSIFSKWYMRPLFWAMGISVEDAGERCVYFMTSAKFGGKGVPIEEGAKAMLTMRKTGTGALLCINAKLQALQQEKVMNELQSQGAGEKVWAHLQRILGPYL